MPISEIICSLKTKSIYVISEILYELAPINKVQKYLSTIMYDAKHHLLLQLATNDNNNPYFGTQNHDAARLTSLTLPGSTTYLQAIPCTDSLKINNQIYETILSQHMGLPLPVHYSLPKKCPFCKKDSDRLGTHFGKCKQRPISGIRHYKVLRKFHSALPPGVNSTLEVHGATSDTAKKRPIDINLYNILTTQSTKSGTSAGADLSIANPEGTSKLFHKGDAYKAIRKLEALKVSNLPPGSINKSTTQYVPMVATIHGGLGPSTINLLKDLACHSSYGDKKLYTYLFTNLKAQLSISIQQQQAELILQVATAAASHNTHNNTPSHLSSHLWKNSPLTTPPFPSTFLSFHLTMLAKSTSEPLPHDTHYALVI